MTAKPETLEQPGVEEFISPDLAEFLDDEDEEGDGIYYYYDDDDNWHELKQRDMSGTGHEMLKQYLMAVMGWLFRAQKCAVYGELNFYETNNQMEKPLYPDIAVLKDQEWRLLPSYRLKVDGPAPNLIIELISEKTRSSDLNRKPKRYQKWGVAEYFAYDERPRKRRSKQPRLWGWRLNAQGEYEALQPAQADGRLWSNELDCWLVPDNEFLRLYDRQNNFLQTGQEAEQQRAERLAQRLRELGEDPDKL